MRFLIIIISIFIFASCQKSKKEKVLSMINFHEADMSKIQLISEDILYKDDFLGDEISTYKFTVDSTYLEELEQLANFYKWKLVTSDTNKSLNECKKGFKYIHLTGDSLYSHVDVSAFFCPDKESLTVEISKM